jgi:hypothetical protein
LPLFVLRPAPDPPAPERLNAGLIAGCKLTLISAPAGFGKTTLVSEWVVGCEWRPVAWLSLDEGDNDPARFLTYLVAALQTIEARMYWSRGVGCAPIPSATAGRIDSDGPAQ